MKILTVEEGRQWLAGNSFSRIVPKDLDASFDLKAMYKYPKDVGQTTRLAKAFAEMFAPKAIGNRNDQVRSI